MNWPVSLRTTCRRTHSLLPGTTCLRRLVGIAPEATIYAIKVFPHGGGGAASSTIAAAVDHAITKKLQYQAGTSRWPGHRRCEHEPGWSRHVRWADGWGTAHRRRHPVRHRGGGGGRERGARASIGEQPRHGVQRPDRRSGQRPSAYAGFSGTTTSGPVKAWPCIQPMNSDPPTSAAAAPWLTGGPVPTFWRPGSSIIRW